MHTAYCTFQTSLLLLALLKYNFDNLLSLSYYIVLSVFARIDQETTGLKCVAFVSSVTAVTTLTVG